MIDIERLSAEKTPLIDRELRKVLPESGVPNLHDAINYHLGTGGKRLRPLLAIITYESLGGSDVKKIIPFSAACELLHNWLLVHDDIEDGDKMRRDKPAVWVKYGLAHGINIGDYMAQKVYELVLNSKDYGVDDRTIFKLISAVVDTTIKTAEGQTMDMNMREDDNPNEEEYMNTIIGKTAYYMTVPMIGGAIVAGRDDLIQKLVEFGKYLGPAFQIADDVLDLTEGKGRKEIGCDIKEGKRSILVIHCLGKCSADEKRKLISILNKPNDETTHEDIDYARNLFEKCGSIDYARKKAEKMVEDSKKIADTLPKGLCEILHFFADYTIQRRK